MTHLNENENELDRATRKEGIKDLITIVLAITALVIAIAYGYNSSKTANEALTVAAVGAEQFKFCQKKENRETDVCSQSVVRIEGQQGPRGFGPTQAQVDATVRAQLPLALSINCGGSCLGRMGRPGDDGTNGKEGQRGRRGLLGPIGPEGPLGPMGPEGPVGPIGPEGPVGPPAEVCPDGYGIEERTVITQENGPTETAICVKE